MKFHVPKWLIIFCYESISVTYILNFFYYKHLIVSEQCYSLCSTEMLKSIIFLNDLFVKNNFLQLSYMIFYFIFILQYL